MSDEIEMLRARLREVERERMSLDAQLAESERQADALRRECAQWERVAHRVETARSEAVRERDEAQREASSADEIASAERERRKAAEREREAHRAHAAAMERERDEARANLMMTRAERDGLLARLAEVEAGAAAMRDAIGSLRCAVTFVGAHWPTCRDAHAADPRTPMCVQCRVIESALSLTAGRALLDRHAAERNADNAEIDALRKELAAERELKMRATLLAGQAHASAAAMRLRLLECNDEAGGYIDGVCQECGDETMSVRGEDGHAEGCTIAANDAALANPTGRALLDRHAAEVTDAMVRGHGHGQEHTIADVNAGRVDDMIAPRLAKARADAIEECAEIAAQMARDTIDNIGAVDDYDTQRDGERESAAMRRVEARIRALLPGGGA